MTRRLTRLTSMIDDPETEPVVRDLLQAGREAGHEPGVAEYDYEAGLARHMAVIAAGAPMPDWAKGLETAGTGGSTATGSAAGSAATGGAGASAALGGVVWLVVPVVTAAVVAAAMWARQAAPVESNGAVTPAVGVHAVQPSAATPSAPLAQRVEVPAAPAVRGDVPVEPEAVVPSEPSAPSTARVRSARGANSGSSKVRIANATSGAQPAGSTPSRSSSSDIFSHARPALATNTPPVAPAPSEQPVREAPARERVEGASAEPAPKPVARLDDARLEREMGMLAAGQRVLHTDPARTLFLMRTSAHEFGDTMFAPERGQLELLALVKLGKLDEAKRLARPYLARYPNGPFSDRVRRALASGRVDR